MKSGVTVLPRPKNHTAFNTQKFVCYVPKILVELD